MTRRALLLGLFAWLCAETSLAASVTLRNLRVWHAPDHSRLVFDLSGAARHNVFSLSAPERVVIDIRDAAFSGVLPAPATTGPFVTRIRSGRPDPGTLRFVLDLRQRVTPRAFVLGPNAIYGHRLVIDLVASAKAPAAVPRNMPRTGDLIVAIDPGHGGEDPGALGARGTREKDVVMSIARELVRQINATPGMRAVLTRDGDYYLSLQARVEKARAVKADLLVSVHADAFTRPHARGSSVFTLSQRPTSAAAAWLAKQENDSDLIGGVGLDARDPYLKQVLVDLSQTATNDHSMKLAGAVLSELGQINTLHKAQVERAGFAVLKAPDVPSILVETAFISNPQEERRLQDERYQDKMARAMLAGIKRYFSLHPPRPQGPLAQK